MAWRIANGELADLKVVAVVLGDGNLQLGEHARETVLYIDDKASRAQHAELVQMLSSRYAEVFGAVKSVRKAEIDFQQSGEDAFRITIPNEVQVVTRSMVEVDHEYSCDPQVWYGAFAGDVPVRLVQMAKNVYSGADLNSKWKTVNKRSAYIGPFSFSDDLAAR